MKDKREFVMRMLPAAWLIEDVFSIKKIICISQAAHESGWGLSFLTIQANNLFGIKATEKWVNEGGGVWTGKTTEYFNENNAVKIYDGFRAYYNWLESCMDWAKLISGLKRYREGLAFAMVGEVEQYAQAIMSKRDEHGNITWWGYCTDPEYDNKLVKTSEQIKEILS